MLTPTPGFWFPPEPDPPEAAGSAQGHVRYEDIAQDGRLAVLALPHSIGLAVWQKLLTNEAAARETQRAGVISVLTRMVVEGTDSSLSVRKSLEYQGCFRLYHTVDDAGAVNRILLNMWTRASAPIGRTYGPPPPNAGESAPVGRVFAEHVFTRLFAPPAERKVLRLDVTGRPPVPPDRWPWHPHRELLELPPGATPLDDALVADEVSLAFGLMHTDSNQHVNSLVYPRQFEEAALRRFATRGRGAKVLARRLEVAYRKPFFAGDRVRIMLRGFAVDGKLGAVGIFVPEAAQSAPLDRAHAYCRMWFW